MTMRDTRIPVLNAAITHLVSTADGNLVGVAAGESVGVLNMQDGSARHVLRSVCHDSITAVALVEAPEPLLVFTSQDAGVRILDVVEGKVQLLKGHTDGATNISVDLPRKRFASCSLDGSVRVWSLPTGEPVACLRGHREGAIACAFGSGGRLFTVAGYGDRFLFSPQFALEKHLPAEPKHRSSKCAAALHALPKGLLMASAERPNLVLWHDETGEVVWKHPGTSLDSPPSIALARDRAVLTGQSITVLDIATGKVVAKWSDFSRAWLIDEPYAVRGFQNTADLFDMKTKRTCAVLDDLDDEVTAVLGSPPAASWPWLAFGLGDGSVRILDRVAWAARPVVKKAKPRERVHFIARHDSLRRQHAYVLTEDHSRIIVACESALRWISMDDGKVVGEIAGQANNVTRCGKYVCCHIDGRFVIYRADTGSEWMNVDLPYGVWDIEPCEHDRVLVYGGGDGGNNAREGWCIVDLERREVIAEVPLPPHYRKANMSRSDSSPRCFFATHETERLAQAYSTEDGTLVATLPICNRRDNRFGVSDDGRLVLNSLKNGNTVLFGLPSGEELFCLRNEWYPYWRFFAGNARLWLGGMNGRLTQLDIPNRVIRKREHLPLNYVAGFHCDATEERWCVGDSDLTILFDVKRGVLGRLSGRIVGWGQGSRFALSDGRSKCTIHDLDGHKRGTVFIKMPHTVQFAPGENLLLLTARCEDKDVDRHMHLVDGSGNPLGRLCDPQTGKASSEGAFADDHHLVSLRGDVMLLWHIDD